MTARIVRRSLLFVLYTAAVLGGAFGISYAVFEWRHDDVNSAAVFECLEEEWTDYVGARMDAPDPPPRDAGEEALNQYDTDFVAAKAQNAQAWAGYTDGVKGCYP